MTEVSEQKPWPLRGYAPGSYMCNCSTCGKGFVGDKRASHCLECAVIATKAALTAAIAVAPKPRVKALEWSEEEIPPTGEYLAYSPVGLYCVPRGRSAFSVRFRGKYEDGPYPTLDAAKVAAQADFERRILAALEDGQ